MINKIFIGLFYIIISLSMLFTIPVSGQQTLIEQLETGIESLLLDYEIRNPKLGHINTIEAELLYIQNSADKKLSQGAELAILRSEILITNPYTGFITTSPEYEIARAEVIAANDDLIVAKIKKADISPQQGDNVFAVKSSLKTAVLDFKYGEEVPDIEQEIKAEFANYLLSNSNFELIEEPEIEQFIAQKGLDILNREQLEAVSKKFGLDIIISGDIYKTGNYVYIYIKAFDFMNDQIKRELLQVSKTDELIKYYKMRSLDNKPYRKLFSSQLLDFKAHNLALADLQGDRNNRLLVNTDDAFKLLSYDDNSIYGHWEIKEYQRGNFDDYRFVVASVNGQDEIIAEKGNSLFKYSWAEDRYQEIEITGFFRNRPKLTARIEGREYLITRDYRHFLNFNYWDGEKYESDFQMDLAANEGYRVAMADLDNNGQQDLIFTVYDGADNYEISIYDSDKDLKYSFPDSYGPILVTTDLLDSGREELFTITAQADQIISFIWDGTEYVRNWQSEKFKADIRDLAVGDLTDDGENELIVLLNKDGASQIVVYGENPYLKGDDRADSRE